MEAAAFNALLETAFNRYLALDPDAPGRLAELDGKVICLQVRGLGLEFFLLPGPEGVHILNHYAGEADTTLSGPPLALARMGMVGDAEDRLFSGEVTMHGDAETGQRFQAIFAELDVDWEEPLSQIVGDVAAHQLGRLARGGADWARQGIHTLERNLGEYLQHERRDLPAHAELEDFYDRVDALRSDAERLLARLDRIDARLAAPPRAATKKKAAAKKARAKKAPAKKVPTQKAPAESAAVKKAPVRKAGTRKRVAKKKTTRVSR